MVATSKDLGFLNLDTSKGSLAFTQYSKAMQCQQGVIQNTILYGCPLRNVIK